MYLYYLSFFKNRGWDVLKVSAYLHARNLNNKCVPEIIEDKQFELYKVNFINEEDIKNKMNDFANTTYKYTIDDVIYCFLHEKLNDDGSTKNEIKHDLI